MEVKDNRKRAASQIKSPATSNEAPISYDSDNSIRVQRKKNEGHGVLTSQTQHGKNTPKHHGAQRYYMMCKKSGMPERKWKSHSSENFFSKRSDRASIKDGLVGALGNWADAVKHYRKPEKKCKRELKALNKQNNMIYRMAKKYSSCREIKSTNKIKSSSSKNCSYYISDISSSDSDSY